MKNMSFFLSPFLLLFFTYQLHEVLTDQLTTTYVFNYTPYGIMFEIKALNNLEIEQIQFSIEPCDFGQETRMLYYKNGSYKKIKSKLGKFKIFWEKTKAKEKSKWTFYFGFDNFFVC